MDTDTKSQANNNNHSAPDQVKALEAQIAELQEKNKQLQQNLEDVNIELQAVNDEFERAYNEVVEARKEVERANNVKSAFLASMSHELRTPLNAIINFTKFLLKEKMGAVTEQQAVALKKVESSGIHLLNLINDVLDISKIESGSMSLLVESSVDVVGLLKRVEPMAEALLEEKDVTLEMNVSDDFPTIIGDRQRIFQILINIMSNACKFTEEGKISVRATSDDTNITVEIADTGSGIAEKEQSEVFVSFKQTEAGLRKGSGTGLGMPISKRLAEAHGGDITFTSTVGVGSTFTLVLPIKSDVIEPNFG